LTAKLIRHPDQLVLVGAPTSAAAAAKGVENGPETLRTAGIADRLRQVGYQVTDAGDLPVQLPQSDPENPRARNMKGVLSMLDPLRLRIEQSAKSHAFPLVLGGDVTVAVALVAGLRRQATSLGLIHMGRHADLHTPMQTDDGLIAPMTVSHLAGQGAAELVRFWKEPPLIREPDLALYGLAEPDAFDRERLSGMAIRRFPIESIRRDGALATAEAALERLRAGKRDFVVLLLMDVFSPEEVPGGARAGAGGLSAAEVGEALNCFAARSTFAGLAICGYDPALDPHGRGAGIVVRLVTEALAARHAALIQPSAEPEAAGEEPSAPAEAPAKPEGEPGAEAKPAAEAKPEAEPAAETEPESEPESEQQREPEPEVKPEPEAAAEAVEAEPAAAPSAGGESDEARKEVAGAAATNSTAGQPGGAPPTDEPEAGNA
jgi:arginase